MKPPDGIGPMRYRKATALSVDSTSHTYTAGDPYNTNLP